MTAALTIPRDVDHALITQHQGGGRLEGVATRRSWAGLRVGIYARISEDDTGDRVGVDRQVDFCRTRVNERGGTIAGEYVDNDKSASRFAKKPRLEWQRLMRDMHAGNLDIVLAYHPDRLYRRLTDFAVLLELASSHADQFALVTIEGQADLSTAGGRIVMTLSVQMAAEESNRTSERVRAANLRMAAMHMPRTGGRRSFGWQSDGTTPNEREAAILRKAWADILRGISIAAIAKEWQANGVRSALDADRLDANPELVIEPTPWSKRGTSVRTMLLNPRHVGDLVYKGAVVASGVWPGIITREDYEQVVQTVERRGLRAHGITPGPRRRTPFTGLVYCARCNQKMERSSQRGRKGAPRRPVYRCANCNISIMAEYVEAGAVETALSRIDDPSFIQTLRDTQPDDDGTWAELAKVDHMIERTDDMWMTGDMPEDSYRRNMLALNERRRVLTERVAALAKSEGVSEWLSGAATIRADWDGLPVDVQRSILHTVIERVDIHPAESRGRAVDPNRVHVAVRR